MLDILVDYQTCFIWWNWDRSDSVAQVNLELMVILLLKPLDSYKTLKQEMRKEGEEEGDEEEKWKKEVEEEDIQKEEKEERRRKW